MTYARLSPVRNAFFLAVVVLGFSCVQQPARQNERQPEEPPSKKAVFGTEIEPGNQDQKQIDEKIVTTGERQEFLMPTKLVAEPVPVTPIVLELQSEISGKAIEVSFVISRTGEVSDCQVVRVGGSPNLISNLSTDQKETLCAAIEQRRYSPIDKDLAVSLQFGTPHWQ